MRKRQRLERSTNRKSPIGSKAGKKTKRLIANSPRSSWKNRREALPIAKKRSIGMVKQAARAVLITITATLNLHCGFAETFCPIKYDKENVRHQAWLERIVTGYFNFPPVNLTYIEKGVGSWKHAALDTIKVTDDKNEKFEFRSGFLTSNWKLFHDALQLHRFYMIHELLLRYGICAA
ncbi:MAG: hypothetical protein JSR32_06750 [Proteobacteria bacterium]|nr:hypothetical protein [Pseudomonadota bacterium]